MKVAQEDGTLTVERPTDRGEHRALHGLTRSLIANMVEGVTAGYQFFEYRPDYETITFAAHAPTRAEFTLTIPSTPNRVDFISAAFVDQTNVPAEPEPQDGVRFLIGARDAAGEVALLHELVYDPTVDERPKPITVSLDAYRGQTIQLILLTNTGDNTNYDWSLWVDPLVIVRPQGF